MKTFSSMLRIASLVTSAANPLVQAQAQAMIYDANGTAVATPAGLSARSGALTGYLAINGSAVLVYFNASKRTSSRMDWSLSDEFRLYFRSSDCSGPALISGDGVFGTVPAVLLPERHHAWLHMADGTEGLGTVTANSWMSAHKQCSPYGYKIEAWKALPAIDLDTMFTPPFSIH
jgi:hypothetical protein